MNRKLNRTLSSVGHGRRHTIYNIFVVYDVVVRYTCVR